ncbi:hypothetical protein BJX96DRAFT_165669 [Aspergillus floccosus]
MPPIPIRQSPSIPGVPRPSTDSAREPIPGTKYISLRVMLELLAGTLAIFIIGVLAWKLGRFIRSFTRKRVLQGSAPTTRYARTWYGWIPLQRHERNRDLAQTCLQRLCGWTTWSSKADYRWVWWDPGSKELQRHNEKRKLRRWLPGFLRSRSFATADDIWNPVLRGPASNAATYGRDSTVNESRDSEIEVRGHLRRGLRGMWDGSFARRSRYSADDARFWLWRTAWTSQLDYISKKNKRRSATTTHYLLTKKSRSLPCLLATNVFQQQHQRPNRSTCAATTARPSASATPMRVLRRSRKYQVWSAPVRKVAGRECPAPGQNSPAGLYHHNRQTHSCLDENLWTSLKLVECAPTDLSEIKVPTRILSDWEIRSVYALSCRLEWLGNQLSPGRRPFHFAMLPNHWINKRTWIVYDPPCRVSIDARRRLDWSPKPKYPQAHRRVAHRPRINSWRNAVNRRRKSLGLASFVKTTELYESSGEDPPDGKVDPASWMLRRPPQGIGHPKNQENVYYEGARPAWLSSTQDDPRGQNQPDQSEGSRGGYVQVLDGKGCS